MLSALFWWNPVTHIFQREVDNLLELRCDAAITNKMDNDQRIAYLNTILSVIKQTILGKEKFVESAAKLVNQDNEGFIQQRFQVVLYENQYKASKIKFVTFLTTMFVFLLSYSVIIQPAYYPPESDLKGQFAITAENAYILVLQDGTMKLFVDDQFIDTIAQEELKSKPYADLKKIKKGN